MEPRLAHGCAERQRRILGCAAAMLRPGGRLVYSTCTLSPEENEETVRWFLPGASRLFGAAFSLPGDDGALDAPEGMLRLYPHRVRGEGHFLACLRPRRRRARGGPDEACGGAALAACARRARRLFGFRRASLRPAGWPTPSWATRCSPRPICRRWTGFACCARACSWER